MAYCSKCGAQLSEGSNFCKVCGTKQNLRSVSPSNNTAELKYSGGIIQNKQKSTVMLLAILLGLIGFFGIGHIYAGKVGRGIVFLIAGWLCDIVAVFTLGIGLVLVIGIYIFQIIDANNTANKLGIT
ncbi:MAG: zinc-ribbon domain-containing protein [Dehalococcoidales bacterium]|nr:zinc-ribbon domain-containing protein [Dehalococcoidales bacterium]